MKPVGNISHPPISPTNIRGENGPVGAVAAPQSLTRDSGKTHQLDSHNIANQGAPVDAANIARIRDAINSGSFAIDTAKLADKMIEMDLLPSGSR